MKIYNEILDQMRVLMRLYYATPALDDQILVAIGRPS
jgi:hypothetical protein